MRKVLQHTTHHVFPAIEPHRNVATRPAGRMRRRDLLSFKHHAEGHRVRAIAQVEQSPAPGMMRVSFWASFMAIVAGSRADKLSRIADRFLRFRSRIIERSRSESETEVPATYGVRIGNDYRVHP